MINFGKAYNCDLKLPDAADSLVSSSMQSLRESLSSDSLLAGASLQRLKKAYLAAERRYDLMGFPSKCSQFDERYRLLLSAVPSVLSEALRATRGMQ